jgi:hypothetical protein
MLCSIFFFVTNKQLRTNDLFSDDDDDDDYDEFVYIPHAFEECSYIIHGKF